MDYKMENVTVETDKRTVRAKVFAEYRSTLARNAHKVEKGDVKNA